MEWGGCADDADSAQSKARADAVKAWSMARAFAGGRKPSPSTIERATATSCTHGDDMYLYRWLIDEVRPRRGELRSRKFDEIAEAITLSDARIRKALTARAALAITINYEEGGPGLSAIACAQDESDRDNVVCETGDDDTLEALMLMGVWMRSIGGRSIDGYVDDLLMTNLKPPQSATINAAWRASPLTSAQQAALSSFCEILEKGGAHQLARRLMDRSAPEEDPSG